MTVDWCILTNVILFLPFDVRIYASKPLTKNRKVAFCNDLK